MASKIKQKLAQNFYEALHPNFFSKQFEEVFQFFQLKRNKDNAIVWRINLPKENERNLDVDLLKNSQTELFENQSIRDVTCRAANKYNVVEVQMELCPFIKDSLDSNPLSLNFKPNKKKVLVEFSSPNIAKPFHVGHLRSTLIGNFLANLKRKLGKNVVKMNYLGDWGTQFGMIQLGVEHHKYDDQELRRDPITLLYNAYVTGNALADKDGEAYQKALNICQKLETCDPDMIQLWNDYRTWTMNELTQTYCRLNVNFDEYSWESDYKRKDADELLNMLNEKGILSTDIKGRQVATVGKRIMPLIKSDNTTLYLIRDLMAFRDRKVRHKFDELYYVVENGQSDHFLSLFTLCRELDLVDNAKLEHVKFGKIHGMSTRRGNVVFLKDVLDEARERAFERQKECENTRVLLNNNDVADVLGVTAVVVNDLKHKRKNDYAMSWEGMLQFNGNTGNYLQYCNCRLNSLKSGTNHSVASRCDPEALLEPQAVDLVIEIARYESALLTADAEIEPSILCRYLFDLVGAINSALQTLNVNKSDAHVASQRLLLFDKSHKVLQEGLSLLGIKPLTNM